MDASVANSGLKQFILKLVEAARGFLVKRIKIKTPLASNLVVSNTVCVNDFTVPSEDRSTGVADTDFHLYVTAEDAEEDWMAYASYCEFAASNVKSQSSCRTGGGQDQLQPAPLQH